MILRAAKFIFQFIVVSIWIVLAYGCVYRLAEEVSFWKSMGGLP